MTRVLKLWVLGSAACVSGGWILSALHELNVAGYAIYYRTFSTFVGRTGIFLEDVYVRPEFRQRGLGRALLEAVARKSVELGGGRLEWNALHWNENALRFYRGLGARVMEDWVLLRLNREEVARLVTERPHAAPHP